MKKQIIHIIFILLLTITTIISPNKVQAIIAKDEIEPTSLSIKLDIEYQRKIEDGMFEFTLYEMEGPDDKSQLESTNNIGNKATFSSLTFSNPGTYYYIVNQVNLEEEGLTYDDTTYIITIIAVDNGGQIELNVTTNYPDKSEFSNNNLTLKFTNIADIKATYDAKTNTLNNVEVDQQYKVNDYEWIDIRTSGSYNLRGHSLKGGDIIKVRWRYNDNKIKEIQLTQADKPTTTPTPVTDENKSDGTITITNYIDAIYLISTDKENWIEASVENGTIRNLSLGDYYLMVEGKDTRLPSVISNKITIGTPTIVESPNTSTFIPYTYLLLGIITPIIVILISKKKLSTTKSKY